MLNTYILSTYIILHLHRNTVCHKICVKYFWPQSYLKCIQICSQKLKGQVFYHWTWPIYLKTNYFALVNFYHLSFQMNATFLFLINFTKRRIVASFVNIWTTNDNFVKNYIPQNKRKCNVCLQLYFFCVSDKFNS